MAIDIHRVKAICFDVDGTLSDTDDQFVQKLVKLMTPTRRIFGNDILPIARKLVMFTEGPGNWAYNLADSLGLDHKIVAISDRLYEMGIGESGQPFQLIQGVREMLANLQNHYPLSIISARGQKSTYRFLFQFELLSHFKAVATGQTCVHTKPYPDSIEWAAEKMCVHPASCLMVGDTVVDILCGDYSPQLKLGASTGFHRCTIALVQIGVFSLLDMLNILRNGLPVPTRYIQFLKSRIGRTLSLFSFCRYISDRLFYYNTMLTPYIPTPKGGGFTALFGKTAGAQTVGVLWFW